MKEEIKRLIKNHIINQEMNLDETIEYIWEIAMEESNDTKG